MTHLRRVRLDALQRRNDAKTTSSPKVSGELNESRPAAQAADSFAGFRLQPSFLCQIVCASKKLADALADAGAVRPVAPCPLVLSVHSRFHNASTVASARRIYKVYLRGQEVDRAGMRARWQAKWKRPLQTQ